MKQPLGFEDGTDRVARLRLSLYGLKQASRLWNNYMTKKLTTLGWTQIKTDGAVFVRDTDSGSAMMAVHVDNFVTFADSKEELSRVRKELHLTFEMKEEDPDWLMGFRLIDDRERRTVTILHTQYIDTILERFNLAECNPTSTPMEAGLQLSKSDSPQNEEEKKEMHDVPFRELVGSLLWTSLVCHPEITQAVCQVARFNANPGRRHWEAAKRILKYLKGRKDSGLVLGGEPEHALEITAYSDASWAEDRDDRRSTSGYVAKLGKATVSWSSKKQTTVATSSCEAEYMAAAYCARHVIWMRRLLTELGGDLDGQPTTFLLDNKSAIDLAKDSRINQRTKHIDIAHHFVRENVENGSLAIQHCPGKEMLADGFTKALPSAAFEKMTIGLGLALQ